MECVRHMFDCQRTLSRAQATLIVGPLFVSPVKALVSLAQIITGFAMSVISGTFGVLFGCNHQLLEIASASIGHSVTGFVAMAYSFVNFFTCGTAGRLVETDVKSCFDCFKEVAQIH